MAGERKFRRSCLRDDDGTGCPQPLDPDIVPGRHMIAEQQTAPAGLEASDEEIVLDGNGYAVEGAKASALPLAACRGLGCLSGAVTIDQCEHVEGGLETLDALKDLFEDLQGGHLRLRNTRRKCGGVQPPKRSVSHGSLSSDAWSTRTQSLSPRGHPRNAMPSQVLPEQQ